MKNTEATTDNYYHHFRPDRANRTRCDVCGRSAGVKSHGPRPEDKK